MNRPSGSCCLTMFWGGQTHTQKGRTKNLYAFRASCERIDFRLADTCCCLLKWTVMVGDKVFLERYCESLEFDDQSFLDNLSGAVRSAASLGRMDLFDVLLEMAISLTPTEHCEHMRSTVCTPPCEGWQVRHV